MHSSAETDPASVVGKDVIENTTAQITATRRTVLQVGTLLPIYIQGVPQLSSHFVLVVCCASHASPIIKWSMYFFSWIKIYAKNGITLKN